MGTSFYSWRIDIEEGDCLEVKNYGDRLVVEDKLTIRTNNNREMLDAQLALLYLVHCLGAKVRCFIEVWAELFNGIEGSGFYRQIDSLCDLSGRQDQKKGGC